jgi:hypothetical protein
VNPSQQQYEQIARYLDGEDVQPDLAQRELVEQIRRDEQAVGPALDVATPPAAMDKARNRMLAELSRPTRPAWRRWVAGVSAAAAAAAIVLAVWLAPESAPDPGESLSRLEPSAEQFAYALADDPENQMFREAVEHVDDLQFQLALGPGVTPMVGVDELDAELERTEREMQDMLLDMTTDLGQL